MVPNGRRRPRLCLLLGAVLIQGFFLAPASATANSNDNNSSSSSQKNKGIHSGHFAHTKNELESVHTAVQEPSHVDGRLLQGWGHEQENNFIVKGSNVNDRRAPSQEVEYNEAQGLVTGPTAEDTNDEADQQQLPIPKRHVWRENTLPPKPPKPLTPGVQRRSLVRPLPLQLFHREVEASVVQKELVESPQAPVVVVADGIEPSPLPNGNAGTTPTATATPSTLTPTTVVEAEDFVLDTNKHWSRNKVEEGLEGDAGMGDPVIPAAGHKTMKANKVNAAKKERGDGSQKKKKKKEEEEEEEEEERKRKGRDSKAIEDDNESAKHKTKAKSLKHSGKDAGGKHKKQETKKEEHIAEHRSSKKQRHGIAEDANEESKKRQGNKKEGKKAKGNKGHGSKESSSTPAPILIRKIAALGTPVFSKLRSRLVEIQTEYEKQTLGGNVTVADIDGTDLQGQQLSSSDQDPNSNLSVNTAQIQTSSPGSDTTLDTTDSVPEENLQPNADQTHLQGQEQRQVEGEGAAANSDLSINNDAADAVPKTDTSGLLMPLPRKRTPLTPQQIADTEHQGVNAFFSLFAADVFPGVELIGNNGVKDPAFEEQLRKHREEVKEGKMKKNKAERKKKKKDEPKKQNGDQQRDEKEGDKERNQRESESKGKDAGVKSQEEKEKVEKREKGDGNKHRKRQILSTTAGGIPSVPYTESFGTKEVKIPKKAFEFKRGRDHRKSQQLQPQQVVNDHNITPDSKKDEAEDESSDHRDEDEGDDEGESSGHDDEKNKDNGDDEDPNHVLRHEIPGKADNKKHRKNKHKHHHTKGDKTFGLESPTENASVPAFAPPPLPMAGSTNKDADYGMVSMFGSTQLDFGSDASSHSQRSLNLLFSITIAAALQLL